MFFKFPTKNSFPTKAELARNFKFPTENSFPTKAEVTRNHHPHLEPPVKGFPILFLGMSPVGSSSKGPEQEFQRVGKGYGDPVPPRWQQGLGPIKLNNFTTSLTRGREAPVPSLQSFFSPIHDIRSYVIPVGHQTRIESQPSEHLVGILPIYLDRGSMNNHKLDVCKRVWHTGVDTTLTVKGQLNHEGDKQITPEYIHEEYNNTVL